jgi:Zn-dependent protease
MRSLRFSQASRNLNYFPRSKHVNIDIAQVFIAFIVLLFSLTVHEMAHAWTADRLGDPTARLLGRVSLNPLVHADLIGTVLFPLVAMTTGAPLIGWAKPVPVNTRRLTHPRRDYVLVAAAGPASNLVMAVSAATLLAALHAVGGVSPQTIGEANISAPLAALLSRAMYLNVLLAVFNMIPIPPLDGGNVLAGLLPYRLAVTFNQIRPYGFLVLYALVLTGGFDYLVGPPSAFILSWLPTQ